MGDRLPDGRLNPQWVDYDGVPVPGGFQSAFDGPYDLCVGGAELVVLRDSEPRAMARWVPRIAVFARSSPDVKEAVVNTLKASGRTVLMCGDGTNDVGALKQSHVGIALLPSSKDPRAATPGAPIGAARKPDPKPAAPSPSPATSARPAATRVAPPLDSRKQAELERRQRAEAMAKQWAEKFGGTSDDNTLAPAVKLGDASIAAPFTARTSSVGCTRHIIRMGRCTLVTTLQMYKILALNSLVSAYSFSVLTFAGVKYSDFQMMASGIVITFCFLFITRSQPMDKLAAERPPTRVFSPYIMLSIFSQFAIHLYCLMTCVSMVNEAEPCTTEPDPEADFHPNLQNTIVFLVATMQEVVTFANNYRGAPWMTGLFENGPMVKALGFLFVMVSLSALEVIPEFNQWLEFVPLSPLGSFKWRFLGVLYGNVLAVVLVERFLVYIFRDRPMPRALPPPVPPGAQLSAPNLPPSAAPHALS
eukprot:NODE_393_length_1549_cov_85.368000_g286_i0.p1 GENE.NODE_393_length_1549_cov_85.368000_g286_i0~~NODE_393_length_1549_cov_85.368000_g286_i0.p1  ORF type:complete len:483 (+),score=122.29 NODE_393_length_1549_cov_85.368000_g286_i0:26-1450(+)